MWVSYSSHDPPNARSLQHNTNRLETKLACETAEESCDSDGKDEQDYQECWDGIRPFVQYSALV